MWCLSWCGAVQFVRGFETSFHLGNWSSAQTADPNLLEFGPLKPPNLVDKVFGELSSHLLITFMNSECLVFWSETGERDFDLSVH